MGFVFLRRPRTDRGGVAWGFDSAGVAWGYVDVEGGDEGISGAASSARVGDLRNSLSWGPCSFPIPPSRAVCHEGLFRKFGEETGRARGVHEVGVLHGVVS